MLYYCVIMQNMKVNSDVRLLVHHGVDIGVTALCEKERC
jgi:hypothetical protein